MNNYVIGSKVIIVKNKLGTRSHSEFVGTVGVVTSVDRKGCEVEQQSGKVHYWWFDELVPAGELSEAIYGK